MSDVQVRVFFFNISLLQEPTHTVQPVKICTNQKPVPKLTHKITLCITLVQLRISQRGKLCAVDPAAGAEESCTELSLSLSPFSSFPRH